LQKNEVTLSTNAKIPNVSIELYNGLGIHIKTEKIDLFDNYKLIVKDLPKGAYFIYIKSKDFNESHKLIVE